MFLLEWALLSETLGQAVAAAVSRSCEIKVRQIYYTEYMFESSKKLRLLFG